MEAQKHINIDARCAHAAYSEGSGFGGSNLACIHLITLKINLDGCGESDRRVLGSPMRRIDETRCMIGTAIFLPCRIIVSGGLPFVCPHVHSMFLDTCPFLCLVLSHTCCFESLQNHSFLYAKTSALAKHHGTETTMHRIQIRMLVTACYTW